MMGMYFKMMFGAKTCSFKGKILKKLSSEQGMWEYVVGVAIGLVIVAFVALPALRTFAAGVISNLSTWFAGINNKIFQVS